MTPQVYCLYPATWKGWKAGNLDEIIINNNNNNNNNNNDNDNNNDNENDNNLHFFRKIVVSELKYITDWYEYMRR